MVRKIRGLQLTDGITSSCRDIVRWNTTQPKRTAFDALLPEHRGPGQFWTKCPRHGESRLEGSSSSIVNPGIPGIKATADTGRAEMAHVLEEDGHILVIC